MRQSNTEVTRGREWSRRGSAQMAPFWYYQAVVINCVHNELCSEIIAGRNRPKSALRASRTRWLDGDGQEWSLVSNSSTKHDPSDPVHGSKRSSKGHADGPGGPLEALPIQPSLAGRRYSKRPPGNLTMPWPILPEIQMLPGRAGQRGDCLGGRGAREPY